MPPCMHACKPSERDPDFRLWRLREVLNQFGSIKVKSSLVTKHTMADLGGDAAGAAEDEGDLYGDLDAVPLAKKAAPSTASVSAAGTASASSGTPGIIAPLTLHGIGKVYDEAAMQQLRADNDRLRAENEALKRNIGTLYRTAKAELARKDERIASLQGQVDSTM